ncbi:MAG: VWA domain-containing protein, partial [Erysipelotrichales bacterium]|nr:VWA domain-containing protein [Erysipelotrichales bacterium]
MKKNNSILSRFTKIVLSMMFAVSLMVGVLPTSVNAVGTNPVSYDKVADPSTLNGWENYFGNTTENAGGVWTDKSVFTDTALGITASDAKNFLVALSAMGSNESVVGEIQVPVDVMIILDMSSSMYNGTSKETATVQAMVDAVNETIKTLENNVANRVGVVIYYGGDYIYPQSSENSSQVLLPLGRYTSQNEYLQITKSGSKLTGIKTTVNSNSYTVPNVAGTYAQQGILHAMEEFLHVPQTDTKYNNIPRVPIFVFMSDGEPTAATEDFTNAHNEDATMGNNQVANRQPEQTDFVTQLTAAYAKEQVDSHYTDAEALFYTLSLGSSISLEVMDPSNNSTHNIDHYWEHLVKTGSVYFETKYFTASDNTNNPTSVSYHTVQKSNGFPTNTNQRLYVDRAFTAADASELDDAFKDILYEISHKTRYYPTLVEGSEHISGNVSFVDKIGEYMHVEDIKGIIINGNLYTGKEMAYSFREDGQGESLGTFENPTALGDNLVWSVQERLGIADANEARTLIGQAYYAGQLSYENENKWSNYIG